MFERWVGKLFDLLSLLTMVGRVRNQLMQMHQLPSAPAKTEPERRRLTDAASGPVLARRSRDDRAGEHSRSGQRADVETPTSAILVLGRDVVRIVGIGRGFRKNYLVFSNL
jgi:hypothetical protein